MNRINNLKINTNSRLFFHLAIKASQNSSLQKERYASLVHQTALTKHYERIIELLDDCGIPLQA